MQSNEVATMKKTSLCDFVTWQEVDLYNSVLNTIIFDVKSSCEITDMCVYVIYLTD